MPKYAFDPSEAIRWHIPIPKPLSPLEVGAFDTPVNCLGINEQWMLFIVVCSDILADRRTWEKASVEQLNFIQQQVGLIQSKLLKQEGCEDDCPDCPDCPETPPQPQPAETPDTGKTGLSYEELEDYYMACVNIAAGLKEENGVLYAKDDCCNWIAIGSITAAANQSAATPLTYGAISNLAAGVASALFPSLPAAPHDNPAYEDNASANRCAKATALVIQLKAFIKDIRDAMDSLPSWETVIFSIVKAALVYVGLGEIALATNIVTILRKYGIGVMVDMMNDLLANDAYWDDLVCNLSTSLSLADSVTGEDITTLYTALAQDTIIWEEKALALLNSINVLEFQRTTNEIVPATECGCEDFLPHGYVPPPVAGNLTDYVQMIGAGGAGINSWNDPSGAGFTDISFVPKGTRVNPTTFQSGYVGAASGQYFHGLGVLFSKSTLVSIDYIKVDLTLTGSFDEVKIEVSHFIPGTGWAVTVYSGTYSANQSDAQIGSGGIIPDNATHFRMTLKGSGTTGSGQTITMSDVKFTGDADGNSFIDKAPGTGL